MADCERGLGRPERAIDLVRSPEAERLDRAGRIELTIVESGARRDLGQHDAAVITLQRLPELRDPQPKPWSARLAFAYADALADAGHQEAATDWFGRAMAFDEDGETDAAERYAELTGSVIEDLEEDFDEDASDADDLAAGDILETETETETDEGRAGEMPERADVPDDQVSASQPQQASVGVQGSDIQDADVQDVEAQRADVADPELLDAGARDAEAQDPDGTDAKAPTENPPVPDEDPRVQAETPGVPDEKPGAGRHTPEQDERTDRPDAPDAKEHGETPGITPAFIEPDFGDVLDEGTADRPKTDD
ncbi:hypothetical protein [Nonomuraea mesophila]|nr:hypothetical protein [Nonomuraea mesophila]